MEKSLSPYHLGKARDLYNFFNVFNSFSWQFLVGAIVILLALRLNASSTVIGAINAMVYAAFFFLPLGKILTRKFSIIKIYSFAWIIRALGMCPLLAVPFAAARGNYSLALALVVLGVAGFHVFRGIGMIANNPVLHTLAAGPDRGAYMTQIQIINSAVGMFSAFVIALVLGREPPLFIYSILFSFGIATGVVSGVLVGKIPAIPRGEDEKDVSFTGIFKQAFSERPIRQFIFAFMLMALVSGVSRAFVMVYAREIFNQGDGMVSLYTVFGSLGNLMAGLLIKFLVDRVGVKPIYICCVLFGLAGLVPVVCIPAGFVVNTAAVNTATAVLFLSFIFFMLNFGFLGAEGIAQTYFIALVPRGVMLDMGILYFFVFGIAGAGGSFFAGLFLDVITTVGFSHFISFKLLFGLLIIFTLLLLVLQKKLTPLGSLPFKGALEVMFSYRDLKAITILDRLNKSGAAEEEEALLGELRENPSRLAVGGLLDRTRSPRLQVRSESIRALETLESLTEDAEEALLADIANNPYTTAYISARILGNLGSRRAIPLLRGLINSDDYMLAGEAVVALARLGDKPSRPLIEAVTGSTKNPRLKIMGVEACGIYKSPQSLPALLDIFREKDPPPYLREEAVLAMSGILGTEKQFYALLLRFREDEALAAMLAGDEAEAAAEAWAAQAGGWKKARRKAAYKKGLRLAETLEGAVGAYMLDKRGEALSHWIMELEENDPAAQIKARGKYFTHILLMEAVLDDELAEFVRLRLLISHWSAWQLRSFAPLSD
jgi:HEAT repeat protein